MGDYQAAHNEKDVDHQVTLGKKHADRLWDEAHHQVFKMVNRDQQSSYSPQWSQIGNMGN